MKTPFCLIVFTIQFFCFKWLEGFMKWLRGIKFSKIIRFCPPSIFFMFLYCPLIDIFVDCSSEVHKIIFTRGISLFDKSFLAPLQMFGRFTWLIVIEVVRGEKEA